MASSRRKLPDALERPVEIAVAAIALLGLPKLLTGVTFEEHPTFLYGLAVLGAAHVLVAVDCLWIKRLGWVVGILTALGTALIVGGQLESPQPEGLWRTDAWFGSVLTYAILLLHRQPQLVLILVSFAAGMVTLWFSKDLGLVPQMLGLIYTASGIGVLWVARLVTIVIAEEYLASRTQRQEQKQEATESAARAEALAGLRREMHDSLLHTLQRMGATWSAAGPDEIRQSCREARERLAKVPAPLHEDTPVDVADALRHALPQGRQVIVAEPDEVLVPESVGEALVGAAREAVRNALKYAPGVPQVHLTQRGDSVRISVADDGPGFNVDGKRAHSLGLEGSVVQRMAAVGGEAQVRSNSDGTTVKLRWPANPPPAGGLGIRARRLVAWLPLPLVAAALFHVLALGWPRFVMPLVITLVVSAAILAGAWKVRGDGLKGWQAAALCVLGMAAFVYNYAELRGIPSTDYDLWAPSLVSAVLIIGLAGQPVRIAFPLAVLVLVGAATVSGVTLGWQATMNSHFGGLLAVLLYTVVTLVLVIGATGVSRHLHVTRRLAAAAELHAQANRVRDAVWVGWLARAEELTGPFLEDVATGLLDPEEPETRAAASRLGARIRDELRLWPGHLELAAELDRLRGLGWDSRLLNSELPPATDEDLVAVLHAVGAPPEKGAQVLVTAEADGATITLTPALDIERHPGLRGWVSIDDPDFTQFRTHRRQGDE